MYTYTFVQLSTTYEKRHQTTSFFEHQTKPHTRIYWEWIKVLQSVSSCTKVKDCDTCLASSSLANLHKNNKFSTPLIFFEIPLKKSNVYPFDLSSYWTCIKCFLKKKCKKMNESGPSFFRNASYQTLQGHGSETFIASKKGYAKKLLYTNLPLW